VVTIAPEPSALVAGKSKRTRERRVGRGKRIKDPLVDRFFMIAVYVLLSTFMLIVLIPLLNIVANSLSDPSAVSSGRVFLWPVDFNLRGYELALRNPQVISGFLNSLFYTAVGTAISVALTVAIAYPLSRNKLFGRKVITGFVVFTMLFAGGLIPTYLVVQSLGLLDTRWALLLPQAIGVWQVIISIAFFRQSIPDELYEAAQLDGASELRFLWTVAIPLSKPLIAVIALMYAIIQWNSYFDALLYLKSDDLFPLQIVLRNILILNTQTAGLDATAAIQRQQLADLLKYSLVVISTVPVLLIYPFVARFFTKGILVGAVKG